MGVTRFGGPLTPGNGVAQFGCTNLALVHDVALVLLADGLAKLVDLVVAELDDLVAAGAM